MEQFDSYWRLLSGLWEEGEGFVIIEHDIEIHDQVIPEFEACGGVWCIFPYPGVGWKQGQLFDHSLGCVRFRGELMRERPEIMERAGLVNNSNDHSKRDYRMLDVRVFDVLRWAGQQPHMHSPPVQHHHYYPNGCSCGGRH